MGKALAEDFPAARAVFEEVDDGAGREAVRHHVRRARPRPCTLTENAQPALMAVSHRGHARAGERGRRRSSRARPPSSPAIRSANIRRWPPPAALRVGRRGAAAAHPRPRDAEGGAGRRGRHGGAARPRARAGGGGRRRSRRKARSVRPPTTMAAGRSSSPATRPRSSARSRSPRPRAPSARCCCRCPRPSIAR